MDQLLNRLRIVLVNTSHPGNMGAAARAMKNMGLSRLYLVDPLESRNEVAYSRAAGADDILGDAVVCATLAEALQGCVWVAGTSARERTVYWQQHAPRECATLCVQQAKHGDVALVFGRERSGLTNEELEHCNALVHIPANPGYSSLNIAAAVQVLCYELRLAAVDAEAQSPDRPAKEDAPAPNEQLTDLFDHLNRTLQDIGFFSGSNPDIIMRRLKSQFHRAQPTRREVAIWRGILTAVQKKVK